MISNDAPRFLTDNVIHLIEVEASQYFNRDWTVKHISDLADLASHPSCLLSDGDAGVFIKYHSQADSAEQLETERTCLAYLSAKAGVYVPPIIGVYPAGTGYMILMEALQEIQRGPEHWAQIGRTLARIHQVKSDRFGFVQDTYFGPLKQDNTYKDTWVRFFSENRLQPYFQMAVKSGHLPASSALQVETILGRLPDLCGAEIQPSLLHGDAQKNNFISTRQGAVVIDPAIYYGHPEIDLAYLDFFQPIPQIVFQAYQEIIPIDPGFESRRNLWRLPVYLALVALEGKDYLPMLSEALAPYL